MSDEHQMPRCRLVFRRVAGRPVRAGARHYERFVVTRLGLGWVELTAEDGSFFEVPSSMLPSSVREGESVWSRDYRKATDLAKALQRVMADDP